MTPFPLTILVPEGHRFQGEAVSVTAPGTAGAFTVLAHHAALAGVLIPGIVTVKTRDSARFFVTNGGVLEVNPQGDVFLMADTAEEADSYEDAKRKVPVGISRSIRERRSA